MTTRPTRRAMLALGAVGLGMGGLEWASLRGRFDNRTRLPATALARYRASLEAVSKAGGTEASIVHIGHSTHLCVVGGLRFLTDPWFSDPAFGALAHARGPAASVDDLGPLDAILVSHDHPDHVDLGALDRIADKRRIVVLVSDAPLAARLQSTGFSETHALGVWERFALGKGYVYAVPALHDIHEIGFVLELGEQRVYFAGDTQLIDAHHDIRERLEPTSAILPVDGTRIRGGGRWVMAPADAVEAAKRLGVRHVIPSHAEARFSDPLVKSALATTVPEASRRFAELVATTLPNVVCHLPEPGERVVLA